MKKLFSILILALISAGLASAAVDSVIITTTVNYHDAFVAAAAANKIGAPLLYTDKDSIPNETQTALASLQPAKIYLIGGPAVISTTVEDSLKAGGYEVIRLWGIVPYGTAATTAEYFWVEGAETAVLVADTATLPTEGNPGLLVMAKDVAIANDAPLLISATDILPSRVESALTAISAKKVILVGNFSEMVKATILAMGIEITAEINDSDDIQNDTDDHIKNKTKNQTGRPLVIIAVGNWNDYIKAPFSPGNGVSRLIKNEKEIPALIAYIQAGNYTRIEVVGKPELAEKICDALTAANINHSCMTGDAAKVAAE